MIKASMREDYFEWICSLIANRSTGISYSKLLRYLFDTSFIYTIDRDENRALDGCELRYKFGYHKDIPNSEISDYLDDRPCSVLEMMVALCNRIEHQFMSDPDFGDRTGQWFWGMIENLGLIDMKNSKYDQIFVSETIARFLNRNYQPDGRGGLVTIPDCEYDLREVEIWCQMMWFLTEYYF